MLVLSRVNTFQKKISAERGARHRGRSLRERNHPILGPSWNDQGTFRREFRLFRLCVLGLEIEKTLSTQDQILYPVQRFSKRVIALRLASKLLKTKDPVRLALGGKARD